MRFLSRRAVLALALNAPAAAFAWQRSPFPNWDDNTVWKLLTDSAWAKPRSVPVTWTKREEKPFTYKDVPGADPSRQIPVGSPVGGIGKGKPKLPDRADLIIRWASALPVRQATALYRQRDEKLSDAQRNQLIGPPAPDYIIELFGVPALAGHKGADAVAAILRLNTTLKTASGRVLRPSKAEVRVLPTTLDIRIHFSKIEPLTLADKEVEFATDLQVLQVKDRFRLSAMQYLGSLEL